MSKNYLLLASALSMVSLGVSAETLQGNTAEEIVSKIKVGWNLGNTLDATGGTGLESETLWGNILTSQEIIDGVKAAGFNAVRVPVSWGNHTVRKYDSNNNLVSFEIDKRMDGSREGGCGLLYQR